MARPCVWQGFPAIQCKGPDRELITLNQRQSDHAGGQVRSRGNIGEPPIWKTNHPWKVGCGNSEIAAAHAGPVSHKLSRAWVLAELAPISTGQSA